jgi:hypothetical protein
MQIVSESYTDSLNLDSLNKHYKFQRIMGNLNIKIKKRKIIKDLILDCFEI